jgi:hypothetical protein
MTRPGASLSAIALARVIEILAAGGFAEGFAGAAVAQTPRTAARAMGRVYLNNIISPFLT